MMPSRKSCRLSTIHSQKFCAPLGTSCMLRVATCAKRMRPSATIHVTTIELVIGKPNGRAISTVCCGSDSSLCSLRVEPEASAVIVSALWPKRGALRNKRHDRMMSLTNRILRQNEPQRDTCPAEKKDGL